MVEYEDELDLLAVVVTDGGEGEGRAHIQLYDNQSGQLLRRVDLSEPWDEVIQRPTVAECQCSVLSVCFLFQTFRHELFFDKDTIVHMEQKKTTFCCHVYKLRATSSELEGL